MDSLYNISFPNHRIIKGLVEIIDVHDKRYFALAVDGKIIQTVIKDDYRVTLLKRKFIKACCQHADISEYELHFVYVDWQGFAGKLIKEYDFNCYLEDYSAMTSFLSQHGLMHRKNVRYLARGVKNLEEVI